MKRKWAGLPFDAYQAAPDVAGEELWVVRYEDRYKNRILPTISEDDSAEWALAFLGGELRVLEFMAKRVLEAKGVNCDRGIDLMAASRSGATVSMKIRVKRD